MNSTTSSTEATTPEIIKFKKRQPLWHRFLNPVCSAARKLTRRPARKNTVPSESRTAQFQDTSINGRVLGGPRTIQCSPLELSDDTWALAHILGRQAIAAGFERHTAPKCQEPIVRFDEDKKPNEDRPMRLPRCHGPSIGTTLHNLPAPVGVFTGADREQGSLAAEDEEDVEQVEQVGGVIVVIDVKRLRDAAAWERVSWSHSADSAAFSEHLRKRRGHLSMCKRKTCGSFAAPPKKGLPTLLESNDEP